MSSISLSSTSVVRVDCSDNEVQFIVNVLGELPSKTGAFPLLQKIVEQANAQQPAQPETEAAE